MSRGLISASSTVRGLVETSTNHGFFELGWIWVALGDHLILVSDTGAMKNSAQGHAASITTDVDNGQRRLMVRRSVLVSSLVTLAAGSSLALAIPSFASPRSFGAPTTLPEAAQTVVVATPSTTIATTTTVVTTTAVPAATATPATTTTSSTSTSTPVVHHEANPTTKSVAHATPRAIVTTVPAKKPTTKPARSATPQPTPTPIPTPTTAPTPAPKPSVAPTPSVRLTLGANIVPSPDFMVAGSGTYVNGVATYENPCITPQSTWPVFTNDPSCTNYILQAINNARAVEGVPAMRLPSNWFSLSPPQQLFVVADLERTDRGLPPYLGLNAALNAEAQHAAQTNSDPGIAAGFAIGSDAQGSPGMGGAWGGGFNVLASDYVWMYLDGWAGSRSATSNIACTSPGNAGCWAHREELLGTAPNFNPGVGLMATNAEMGTGFAVVAGHASLVDLIELPKGALPPMSFTWAANVVPFLN